MDNSYDQLSTCHVNCQSLFAHLDEFRSFFETKKYHIICLSETWFKQTVSDQLMNLSGYQIFRRDRSGKNGGGVAFYLTKSLHAKILLQSEGEYCRKPEYLIAEISIT